ncbi:Pro_isomerase domain-containing protein [Cephalotus follicularis]|uniref:Peptidyl-prolyl cis-trans isomerase n=1 Tax=Cephalotus follicularis TaxID=3775 RepID=A0A1Q3BSB7_CEPFO|nr:Pro_isomerase domain-containing protein [Cephalotus follicularis]
MARIKPLALLVQSKKKKGPTRISATTVIFCNLIVGLIVLSLVATYRNWSRRSRNALSTFEDTHSFADSKKYDLPGYAAINTSKGYLTVELFKDGSPETVDKFLDLCQKGHFKGMPFHHVIKNYVIQGGNFQGLGAAEDWTSKVRLHSQLATSPKHDAFMLGTLKTKDIKGFELFITTAPIPDLSDNLVVFGRVVKGQDVVQEIEEVDTDEHYRPKSPIRIINVTLKSEI